MKWIEKLVSGRDTSTDADISRYPSRTYRRVLCSRQHCTEACYKVEYYRFWALFFSQTAIDYNGLLLNIPHMSDAMRFQVYLKCLGRRSIPEEMVKDESDSGLMAEIFARADKKFPEEQIFKIYKALERDFPVDRSLIKLIVEVYKLEEAYPEGVYSILYYLMRDHGLVSAFKEPANNNNIGDSSSCNNNNNSNIINCNNSCDLNEDNSNNIIEDECNEDDSNKTGCSNRNNKTIDFNKMHGEEELPSSTVSEIWKIVLDERPGVFINITDLVVSLENASYEQVMKQAADISLYKEPGRIVTVLAARSNSGLYRQKYTKKTTAPAGRKEENYFDFLVVQNELIKAQENIREELNSKIDALEDINLILKMENKSLENQLIKIKNKLRELQEEEV